MISVSLEARQEWDIGHVPELRNATRGEGTRLA
jgi:hypothetical protein